MRERRPQSLKKGDKRPKRIAPKKTMILIPKSKAQSPLVRCPTGAFKGQCRNRILRTVVSRRGCKPKNVIIIISREGWDRCRLGGVIHLTCTFSCVVQMNKFRVHVKFKTTQLRSFPLKSWSDPPLFRRRCGQRRRARNQLRGNEAIQCEVGWASSGVA